MKLLLFLFAALLSLIVSGQDVKNNSEACDTALTHWTVETLPEYTGGSEKLLQDLNDNLNLETHFNGPLRIDFLINCKGKSSGFKVDSGFDKELETQIIKAFSALQNWKAAKYKNENVDCSYTLELAVKDGYLMLER